MTLLTSSLPVMRLSLSLTQLNLVCALPASGLLSTLHWVHLSSVSAFSSRQTQSPVDLEVTPITVVGLCESLVGSSCSLPQYCECHSLDNGLCLQDAYFVWILRLLSTSDVILCIVMSSLPASLTTSLKPYRLLVTTQFAAWLPKWISSHICSRHCIVTIPLFFNKPVSSIFLLYAPKHLIFCSFEIALETGNQLLIHKTSLSPNIHAASIDCWQRHFLWLLEIFPCPPDV